MLIQDVSVFWPHAARMSKCAIVAKRGGERLPALGFPSLHLTYFLVKSEPYRAADLIGPSHQLSCIGQRPWLALYQPLSFNFHE